MLHRCCSAGWYALTDLVKTYEAQGIKCHTTIKNIFNGRDDGDHKRWGIDIDTLVNYAYIIDNDVVTKVPNEKPKDK